MSKYTEPQSTLDQLDAAISQGHINRILQNGLHAEIARQAEIVDALDREIHHDLKAGTRPPEDFFQKRKEARVELARLLSRMRIAEEEDTPLDHEAPWHALA